MERRFTNLPTDKVDVPTEPKWLVSVDEMIRTLRGKITMRQQFTNFWNGLNTHVKSALISGSGLLVAIAALQLGKYLFPGADFTSLEYAITVALAAFGMNFVKERTLTDN